MERVAPVASKRTRPLGAVLSILAAAALIAVACTVHSQRSGASELLSPLQVGRYAVRAERQSGDYDSKAERQIAFATDSDNAATSERELAAKEEKRARESAYLAADVKSRIDKILEAGRDQVLCWRQGGELCVCSADDGSWVGVARQRRKSQGQTQTQKQTQGLGGLGLGLGQGQGQGQGQGGEHTESVQPRMLCCGQQVAPVFLLSTRARDPAGRGKRGHEGPGLVQCGGAEQDAKAGVVMGSRRGGFRGAQRCVAQAAV